MKCVGDDAGRGAKHREEKGDQRTVGEEPL